MSIGFGWAVLLKNCEGFFFLEQKKNILLSLIAILNLNLQKIIDTYRFAIGSSFWSKDSRIENKKFLKKKKMKNGKIISNDINRNNSNHPLSFGLTCSFYLDLEFPFQTINLRWWTLNFKVESSRCLGRREECELIKF